MVPVKKILLVDNDKKTRSLVSDFLRNEGYAVQETEDGKFALSCFHSQSFNLIILEVMIPEYDGWTLCKEIRKTSDIPIIVLTSRSEEADELFAFSLGVDEYITKPFSLPILAARIQALLRRAGNKPIMVRTYEKSGGLEINQTGHIVSVDGKRIDLSPKEYKLLLYFYENRGIALTREKILNSVWNYDYYGDIRTVDTHVKKLRLKLGTKGKYIQTVRGIGYRFDVES